MNPTIRDLADLVAFATVSNKPVDPMVAWIATRLEDLGLRVERLPSGEPGKSNLVATVGPPGTDGLVLSGHLDVVPTEGQPWTTDPFRLTERDDRLIGRGTADMKGFLAAVLAALTRFRPSEFRRELVLIWTYDEEVGCLGAAHLVQHWDTAARPLPTACLIGEPTDFRILRMHAGHVAVHVHVRGEAAHTSRPDLGRNAIELAAQVVRTAMALAAELRAEADPSLPLSQPWVPFVVTRIHGGTAINIVPDACQVDLGYRPLPGMDSEVVFARFEAMLDHTLGAGRAHVHAHLGTVTPSMLTPAHTPLARLLAPDARPGPEDAGFATDGGQLARLGTQPLVFGPGSIDVAHKAGEYILTQALLDTVPILERLIADRCVHPPEA